MENVKKLVTKKPNNNVRVGMLVASNNPKSDAPADIGIVIKKYKIKSSVRYDILWQKDKEISVSYSATDILMFREFYKMWEQHNV